MLNNPLTRPYFPPKGGIWGGALISFWGVGWHWGDSPPLRSAQVASLELGRPCTCDAFAGAFYSRTRRWLFCHAAT